MSQKVALLFGGSSSERYVSVASAQNLAEALPQAELWFLAPGGGVHRIERSALLAHTRPFETEFVPNTTPFAPHIVQALGAAPNDLLFFLALHGGEGEDGTLQRRLEERGLAFTGSGSTASALAFDKARAKLLLSAWGVRVASGETVTGSEASVQKTLRDFMRLHGRFVVKPVADGSSIGLRHITLDSDIELAAREIAAAGVPYLAERFVAGRELTVSVLERGGQLISLAPSEAFTESGRPFDYAGKFLAQGAHEQTPASLDPVIEQKVRELATTAHAALGCYGYSRTDMILGEEGLTYLETNSLPGLSKASFFPQQLAVAGESLTRFAQEQIELAVKRPVRPPEPPQRGGRLLS